MKIVVITGPSGSGKSNLSSKLSKLFDNSIVLKTDSYYRDNKLIKFLSRFKFDIYDMPVSINRKEIINTLDLIFNKNRLISFSHYNFKTQTRSKALKSINYTGKNQLIILEGIFSHCLDLNYQNTINILCKEEKEICFKRRLIRDQIERNRKSKEINKKFNRSWYLFYKNITEFINTYKVLTINPADNVSYEKLITILKNTKKNNQE